MTATTPREVLDEFGPMTFGPGCEPFNHPIGCQCPYPMAQAERDRLAALTRREPLDVERLADALHAVYCRRNAPMHSATDHSATRIAAEYARLAEAEQKRDDFDDAMELNVRAER